jgi:hypothetical protein
VVVSLGVRVVLKNAVVARQRRILPEELGGPKGLDGSPGCTTAFRPYSWRSPVFSKEAALAIVVWTMKFFPWSQREVPKGVPWTCPRRRYIFCK